MNMNNKIELKSINELFGMNFYIPAYQRGYRWNFQQVKDLLEDIQEFIVKKKEGFYCIQPLVVKRSIPDGKINDFKTGLYKICNTVSEKLLVDETEKLIFENILFSEQTETIIINKIEAPQLVLMRRFFIYGKKLR